MRTTLLVAASLPLLLTACSGIPDDSDGSTLAPGGTTGTVKEAPANGLPCEVDAILAKHCGSCHGASPQTGAPMSLVTLADLTAKGLSDPSKQVHELVAQRIRDEARPMPPSGPLTDEDASVIERWSASGAPAGTAACDGAGVDDRVKLSCTPDIALKPSVPHVIHKDDRDSYACYGVDVQVQGKRHITAFAPLIDNSALVHHILLYKTRNTVDPAPQPCGAATSATDQLVGVWAPGGDPIELPPEAGFPLEDTTHFRLQIHYSNLRGLDDQKDSSGYSFCTTPDLRPNDADIVAFGTIGAIDIPAHGSQDVTCSFDIRSTMSERTALWGMPHMHKLGRYISTSVLPDKTGAPIDLGTADPWLFDNQSWRPLSAKIKGGDRIVTRCAWENNGNAPVGFGEETEQEMCFSFVMYYPRIDWLPSWGVPAAVSRCQPTPAQ